MDTFKAFELPSTPAQRENIHPVPLITDKRQNSATKSRILSRTVSKLPGWTTRIPPSVKKARLEEQNRIFEETRCSRNLNRLNSQTSRLHY